MRKHRDQPGSHSKAAKSDKGKEMGKRLIMPSTDTHHRKSTFARAIAGSLITFISTAAPCTVVCNALLHQKGNIFNGEPRTENKIEDLGEIHNSFVYNPDLGSYETYLNSENVEREIRSIEVSSHVSRISQIHEVRARMVELQRQTGVYKGIVMTAGISDRCNS
jgi:cytidylate kinase